MSQDYRYFKFRPINKYLIESLVTPSLFFSLPSDLNDPFDCQIDLDKTISAAVSRSSGTQRLLIDTLGEKEVLPLLKNLLSSAGICSFSLSCYETMLWTHYADQHKGLCILYRFPRAFLNDPKTFIGVDKVKYRPDIVADLLKIANRHRVESRKQFAEDAAKLLLTTKSASWKCERETRIIRHHEGVLKIDPNFVEQICFGLQTPAADVDLVLKLSRAHCPSVSFTRMVRDARDFGFTMEAMPSD